MIVTPFDVYAWVSNAGKTLKSIAGQIHSTKQRFIHVINALISINLINAGLVQKKRTLNETF